MNIDCLMERDATELASLMIERWGRGWFNDMPRELRDGVLREIARDIPRLAAVVRRIVND